MPDSIKLIGKEAFSKCTVLENIDIPAGVTEITERLFEGCESLTSITIPDGVKVVGWRAFCNCKLLENTAIPESVTNIGIDVFKNDNNVMLLVKKGSYAENYAKENNISFTA